MRTIRCIVVDDEPLGRDLITTFIGRREGLQVEAVCRNATEAFEAIKKFLPDVVFLDVQMPLVSGVDLLKSLDHPPLIIFTTAFSEYAVKAFDLNAVDYLLKPVSEERFLQAVEKAEAILNKDEGLQITGSADSVFFKQEGRLVRVQFRELLYVEALKDFSKLYLKDRAMLLSAHLKLVEASLPPQKFSRIHRSYIVSLEAITAIQGNTVEIGPKTLPVGGLYKETLYKKLGLACN